MYALLAVVFAALAGLSFLGFTHWGGSTLYLVGFILCALLMIVFGGLFLSSRLNKTDDIHITE